MAEISNPKSQPLSLHLLHFSVGFGLSSLLVFAIVSLSLWMTHTSPMALNLGQIAIAVLIPIASGICSVLYPRTMEKFSDAIADAADTFPF